MPAARSFWTWFRISVRKGAAMEEESIRLAPGARTNGGDALLLLLLVDVSSLGAMVGTVVLV